MSRLNHTCTTTLWDTTTMRFGTRACRISAGRSSALLLWHATRFARITGERCRDCTSPFLHSVRSTAGCSALRLFRYPHSLSPRRRLDPCMPHRPTGVITDSAAVGEVRNLFSVSREINIIRAWLCNSPSGLLFGRGYAI